MKQSENITELLAALEAVQAEMPTMPKNSQAYGYKYTDLDTITQTIKPILHKHALAYMQSIGSTMQGQVTLTTRLFNSNGQYIEDTVALPVITNTKNNEAQTLGMSITYMRRYALCAMLGITSDEDVDANAEKKEQPQKQPSKQSIPPKVQVIKDTFNGEVVEPKQPPAKLAFEPKGGETTPAEKKEIAALLSSKGTDGKPLFSKDEMKAYSDMRKDKTASELIDIIKAELQNRVSSETELQGLDIF
ncbi:ERF family protein [Treponema denticola]|uniref:ERF family protein n=1 Tax=Treponema denticola TaxID=158 RepID=UPI0020A56AD3|nr:ERF family protein [Treponema denticola]UTC93186.1 ERF family protein [Treponema denticola]